MIEAVLLSFPVQQNIVNGLSFPEMIVKDSNITSKHFILLLEIACFGRITICRSKFSSSIKISRKLMMDRLELLFLSISNYSSNMIEIGFG
jgi:hypothetical protein